MNRFLEKAYAASPLWLQQLGVNAYGWYWSRRRLGEDFQKFTKEYIARESWSADRMHEFVDRRVREQVQRAYREVPFHRESFQAHGVLERELEAFSAKDLPRLPFLEKAALRKDSGIILTQAGARHKPAAFSTSGTTGTPIQAFWTSSVHQHNIAVRAARSFRWAGVSYGDSRSMIGGRLVVPKAHSRPPFWRYNRWEKQLYLSAFHISPANVSDYVAALNRWRPTVMTGYASGNFFLARFIEEIGLEVHSPRAVITGSERLEPHMRATIERVFRTRAYEEYGSVENCALATECEHGRLHVNVDFGIVEIVRQDGTATSPGEVGEIIATGFANTDQLFIRYRTGDLGAWSHEPCPCGRSTLPVLETIVGRQEDTIVAPDGREMVRFHGIFVDLGGVAEGQVIQNDLRNFTVKLLCPNGLQDGIEAAVRHRMLTRLGSKVDISVERVDSIPREPNGKFRAVISRVPRTPATALPAAKP